MLASCQGTCISYITGKSTLPDLIVIIILYMMIECKSIIISGKAQLSVITNMLHFWQSKTLLKT